MGYTLSVQTILENAEYPSEAHRAVALGKIDKHSTGADFADGSRAVWSFYWNEWIVFSRKAS